MFQRKGYVSVEPAGDAKDSEEIVWGALENGATDFNTVDSEDPNVLEVCIGMLYAQEMRR